ncbi:MAG: 50S ribosomal protein L23 [Planctomycetes bacterium]|nr:50S ribosomal protein L23 [Planctomycetota bacterium]
MRSPWTIIKKPIVTERSMANQQKGVYTFVVDRSANKHEIKWAVEQAFKSNKVKVRHVRTLVVKGKAKRMKNMLLEGRRKDWKKAYVTLKEGRLDII